MLRLIRYILWGAIALLSLFLSYQYFFASPNKPQVVGLNIEKIAPPLVGIDYSSRDWTVVNFFASWCVPCQAEHPLLMELAQELDIVGIAWKDHSETATKKWLTVMGSPFEIVIHDPNNEQGRLWRIAGIPATFLVDQQGRIRYRRIGVLQKAHLGQMIMLYSAQ